MQLVGKAIKCGDNIDTDIIIPARYLNAVDETVLAAHCMEDLIPGFRENARGAILVAGKNFGCGSSREHAPVALKACGIICVLAANFARIFYRNAINIGLPILECPAAAAASLDGDELEIVPLDGLINNISRTRRFRAAPFPSFVEEIIKDGGLLNMAKKLTRQAKT